MKYFFDIENGYYCDIGAYDPIFKSTTLNLFSLGWNGINVDASFNRMRSFNMLRPNQVNLNTAIGQADIFVVLYDLLDDSTSTISRKVVDFDKERRGRDTVNKKSTIPSMNMSQLCRRYFLKKPLFLNLDI